MRNEIGQAFILGSFLTLASTTVLAQGTGVTLYGAADLFFGHATGSAGGPRIVDGGITASQFGFRGIEDIGGGWKASFVAEAGINLDTGTGTIPGPGLAFSRQAFVGLESSGAGKFLLGRQYTPIFKTNLRSDVFGVNSVFSTNILWAQTEGQAGLQAWAARADNALQYTSPVSFPVQVELMYGPGETPGNNSNARYMSASLSYASGPLFVGYGYQLKNNGTLAAPVASPTKTTSHLLGASYTMGSLRLTANYGFQSVDAAGAPKAKIMSIGGRYDMGAHALLLSVGRRDLESSSNDQTAVTLGYNYALSKRTQLYGRYIKLNNSGTSLVSLAGMSITKGGDDGSLLGFGIEHRF